MQSSDTGLRQRDLTLARSAFSLDDEHMSRQLSKEAHGLLSSSPTGPAPGAPWTEISEAGHNEELASRGMTLALRGATDGVMISASVLSIAHAARWPLASVINVDIVLLACWAAYSACREALEIVEA